MMPVVLDVTRTLSPKSIATPTGIDRVERAYIQHFLDNAPETLFLCKVGRRYYLTDRDVMLEDYANVLNGDLDARENYRKREPSIWKEMGRLLGLRQDQCVPHLNFPDQFTYLNVGHTNMGASWLKAVRKSGAKKIIGLIHDMIPLDHPDYQTPKSVARFEKRIRALSQNADIIISNSQHTADRVAHWFDMWGSTAEVTINPLGVAEPLDVEAHTSSRPYFVQLGTIEPRKNHALTLRLWEGFQEIEEAERPILHIIGRRGWLNEDVFEILDNAPFMGRDVFVHDTLTDEEVAAYLKGAAGLLFPSLAEGYGFPLLEAAQFGVPVIASDLPVFREFGQSETLYIDPANVKDWQKAIKSKTSRVSGAADNKDLLRKSVPRWDEHFVRLGTIL